MTEAQAPDLLATFLVERYWPGVRADEVRAIDARLQENVTILNREGVPVRYLSSTLIPEEESVFSLFQGRSAEDVAELNRRSGVSFDRILLATQITPSGMHAGPAGHPGTPVR